VPTLTRAAFVDRFANKPLSTRDINASQRLNGVDTTKVDANRNGNVDRSELKALFDQLSGGRDVLETTRSRRRMLGLLGAHVTQPTRAGRRLAALDSIAASPTHPPVGSPGHDPFRPEARMPQGPFAGEKIDTDMSRSAQRLSRAEIEHYAKKAGVDPKTIALGFANLRQKFPQADGDARFTWSVALVPKDAVADVALLKETFPAPVPAAHTLMRFSLKPGKEAYVVPQAEGDTRPVERQRNLAMSIEAAGPKGWQYDLFNGVRDHFATAYNMETAESRFRHVESYDPPHPVEQLPLKLTHAQKQRVLAEAVDTATRAGMGGMYNTVTRNCTNELFHILDRGIGNNVPAHVHVARAATSETLPIIAEQYLQLRGVLDDSRKLPSLRDEMRR
jgi:hypothetical protein